MDRGRLDALWLHEEMEGGEYVTGHFRTLEDGRWGPPLPVEEAIAKARRRANRVIVRLGDEEWDASAHPTGPLVWPPPDLDLRRRFHYEPADSRRITRWRVRWRFDGTLVRAADVRRAVRTDPDVVALRVVEEGTDGGLEVEVVVEPGPGRSALRARYLGDLPQPPVDPESRRRADAERAVQGHDGPVSFWASAVSIPDGMPQLVGVTPDEGPPAA